MVKKETFYIILLLIGVLLSAFKGDQKIQYFQSSTISLEPDNTKAFSINFKDSIPSDTLFQIRSQEGIPISYYRKVNTGICFDNQCRLLDIKLFWNITGRYLGFELPEKEFLSKAEHEPFEEKEYERLHEILAHSESPLGKFAYNQLMVATVPNFAGVDAVSSATSPDVLQHVVEGAVYTTYMLWHTVYGNTQDEVKQLTLSLLTPELVLQILESLDASDRMWVVNEIPEEMEIINELRDKLLQLIDQDNYSLAERSINAFDSIDLTSEPLQLLLLEKFYQSDYSLQKLIINKLNEAPELSCEVTLNLAFNIENFSGDILSRILDIFQKHNVSDSKVLQKVAVLLDRENVYVSKKVYNFLKHTRSHDKVVEQELLMYEKKRATQ